MIELFKKTKFRKTSLNLLNYCNDIVREYMDDGFCLTLRQLYYQLVSVNVIQNTERSYKNLGNLVSKARLSGMMDWSAIEDRVRAPNKPLQWKSIQDAMKTIFDVFRLPRLNGQEIYVELWVEKDALAGILEPIAFDYHIVLMVNRGYSSQSAMYDSAKRIKQAVYDNECNEVVIFYLGDLDPSGEDMVRDIEDRLTLFMDKKEEYGTCLGKGVDHESI